MLQSLITSPRWFDTLHTDSIENEIEIPAYNHVFLTIQVKAELALKAESQSSRALWGGMALLSVQGGALAWLTWWVYSWDVMEPVTYFITYGTSLGIFAYCVLANQVNL